MATTTTNYAFDVPTSSDLVKNGATAIAELGQDIDTFLFRPFSRNIIINGGFDIWQRGTSSSTSGWTCADRWYNIASGTTTFSQDTSVPTAQGVQYSYKWTTGASTSYGQYYTALESATVKPLRGQSVVFSFWVKTTGTAFTGLLNADAAYSTSTDAYASQTVAVTITGATSITPTSTWTKYSGTLTIPSDATGFKIGIVPTAVQASGVVVYLAAVQLELGNKATPFIRAGGTIQGELAACQRYYFRSTPGTNYGGHGTYGSARTTTVVKASIPFPVQMRVIPTSIDYSTLALNDGQTIIAVTAVAFSAYESQVVAYPEFTVGSASLTQYRPYHVNNNNNSAAYLGFSAEL